MLRLLTNGLAWHFTEFSHDRVLATAEHEARVAKRGLWSVETLGSAMDVAKSGSFERQQARRTRCGERTVPRQHLQSWMFHADSCRNARLQELHCCL